VNQKRVEALSHYWISRRWLPGRRGQPCRLLRASRGKFLLKFGDGFRVLTVRGTFRRTVDEAVFGCGVL